jgi:hypothetical protein
MAFPTIDAEASGFTGAGANVTVHTVNIPATSAGKLYVAMLSMDGSRSDDDAGWPAGWTEFVAIDSPAGASTTSGMALNCAYRIADGSEGASITYTTAAVERGAYGVYLIGGWHGTTVPEAGTEGVGNSTAPDPGALTWSWGAEDTLLLAVSGADIGTTTHTAAPTNYTDLLAAEEGTSGGVSIGIARRNLNGTTDDPSAFTTDAAADWAAVLIAIRPAAAGVARVPRFTSYPQILAH